MNVNAKPVVLIDFWAEWCQPCKKLSPVLDQLAVEMHELLQVVKVNVDEQPEIGQQFGVMSVPTLVLFADGERVAQRTGFVPLYELRSWVEEQV